MTKIRIFGAGVRANLVADLLAWQFCDRFELEGYYCDEREIGAIGPRGFPILGTTANGLVEVPRDGVSAFICLGTYASDRGCEVFAGLREKGVLFPSLVSPAAQISPSAKLGDNALVFPGVFIGCEVRAGHLLCVHGGTVIEHHVQIGHNVLFGPGVSVAGSAQIASHSFVGAGAAIIPEVKVGHGTFIGAGSTVITDLPPHRVAYGQPAKPRRAVAVNDEVPTATRIAQLGEIGLG